MKLGVLTVLYQDLPRADALDRVAALGLDAVELGTGNYPGAHHCDPDELLDDQRARDALKADVESRGLTISALSCHGNPLHPDDAAAGASHDTWRKTARLASELEVPVVNLFSGCPGDGPDARHPNWVTCAWPDDYVEVLRWQWDERVVPYWTSEAEFARRLGVRIAFEMHPGFVVYNPETLLRLRDAAGNTIGANFDPSHLYWQGIDPVEAIRALGARGAIFHVHAKDTYVDRANVRVNGVLDTKPYDRVLERAWTFRTVGYGHGESAWRDQISALRTVGYDYVMSIEHEDALMSIDEGLAKAVDFLRPLIVREPPAEMWWS
ncbi:MAG TPA: sugar phosphate isomerase/epimerase [Actinomycetota bacterium]|nr:sugar phosphate isomerase/epimerase [Actinomycetota bacterium]